MPRQLEELGMRRASFLRPRTSDQGDIFGLVTASGTSRMVHVSPGFWCFLGRGGASKPRREQFGLAPFTSVSQSHPRSPTLSGNPWQRNCHSVFELLGREYPLTGHSPSLLLSKGIINRA